MNGTLRGISSMATRQLLAELVALRRSAGGAAVEFESVGGVDAAKRVQAGEPFDLVVLAADAIAKLEASGHVLAGSRVDLVQSAVAACVKAGAAMPDFTSEESVKQAVLAAPSIGYSTGPSGVALQKLFERWSIAADVGHRTVQAPPGVPVASLVAKGEVALGFQQLSELLHVPGIAIVEPLPDPVRIVTTFSGAVCATSSQADAARELLAFMASPATADAKRRQGMQPA